MRLDEGYISKKDALPITAINVGDTGSAMEKFKYTVGWIVCFFWINNWFVWNIRIDFNGASSCKIWYDLGYT